jgi:hypothetical protein
MSYYHYMDLRDDLQRIEQNMEENDASPSGVPDNTTKKSDQRNRNR